MVEGQETTQARFFIDHGMVHDRVTGKHVTTDPDSVFCDGREACCALLNQLSDRADRAVKVLRAHHEWHQQIGTVIFPAEDGQTEPTEINLSDAYAEGSLCDRTMEAIQ